MDTEIRTAIYTLTLTASSLTANNTFWIVAPQELTGAYCVISPTANPVNRDTAKQYEEVYFQFAVYGTSLEDLEDLIDEIKGVWDTGQSAFAALLTNYSLVGLMRSHKKHLKVDDTYWQIVIAYKLEVEPV